METLILLHGAIGAPAQLQPLADALSEWYDVRMVGFSGHGGAPFAADAFSMPLFAGEVLAYMDAVGLEKASIFGYSMGGYVAMYIARHHGQRVGRVITLATKYQWSESIAAKEIQMLDPAKIELKLPAFASLLGQRHAPNDWKEVLARTAAMMTALGADNPLKPEDYAEIAVPVLLLLGDRDKMVTLEETVAVYKALPKAQLCVLPGTPHPIEQADVKLAALIAGR